MSKHPKKSSVESKTAAPSSAHADDDSVGDAVNCKKASDRSTTSTTSSVGDFDVAEGPRSALILHNFDYPREEDKLPCKEDGKALSTELKGRGWDVLSDRNLTSKEIWARVKEHVKELKRTRPAVSLFYYCGHGNSVSGDKTDILLLGSDGETRQSVAVVLRELATIKNCLHVVILNCCRTKTRDLNQAVTKMDFPDGISLFLVSNSALTCHVLLQTTASCMLVRMERQFLLVMAE
jgi:hypothetical protein